MGRNVINEVPDEVLDFIFSNLSSFGDRFSIYLTCKKLQKVIEPDLYRDLRFKKFISPKKQLQIFLQQRNIPNSVRTLSIPHWWKSDDIEIDEEDVKLVKALDPDGSIYNVQVMSGGRYRINSIMGALISLCPNLKELECQGISSDYASHWQEGFWHAARGSSWPNSFLQLTRIAIENYNFTNGTATGVLRKCLTVPSLREFRACNFNCWTLRDEENRYHPEEERSGSEADGTASNVRSIELRNATLPARAAETLIATSQNTLQSFRLEFTMRPGAPVELNLSYLSQSLTRATNTLEDLEITWKQPFNRLFIRGTLGLLRTLVNLRRLRADKELLVDNTSRHIVDFMFHGTENPNEWPQKIQSAVDILPWTLESLELVCCARRAREPLDCILRPYLEDLAAARDADKLAHLRYVGVDGFTLDWVPPRLVAREGGPTPPTPRLEARFSESGLQLASVWCDGQCFALGARPGDATWVPRRGAKQEWRALALRMRKAGIEFEPVGVDLSAMAAGNAMIPVVDDDPFGLDEGDA